MNNFRSLENIIRDVAAGKSTASGYTVLENSIRKVITEQNTPRIEKHQGDQIGVGTYTTQHFEMCPAAQLLYADLPKGTDPNLAEKSAITHDKLFALEKQVISKQRADHGDVADAQMLAKQIKHFANQMNLGKQHDYVDMHVDKISKLKTDQGNIIPAKELDIDKERNRHMSPPTQPTPETRDMDIDNTKFLLSRNLKAQRKLKIIDND